MQTMRRARPAFVATPTATARTASSPTSKCTRRSLLLALPSLAVSAALLPRVLPARAAEEPSAATDARGQVSGDVSLASFAQQLEAGRVSALWFYGPFAEYCAFQTKDGKFFHITEGYPAESPRSPESPLQIAARARENGVPYFLIPIEKSFLRK